MFYWTDSIISIAISVLLVILGSCETERKQAPLYPIDSLITAQADHLADIGAGLHKVATLDGKTDTVTYTPDSLSWVKELQVFRDLDIINKPVNQAYYVVNDGSQDDGSNLTVKAFTAKRDNKRGVESPIVYLKVFYQGAIGKPRKVEALFDETNPMHRTARILSMHFEQVGDQIMLTSYSIKGGQKMLLGDSVAFHVNAKILID